MLALLLPLSVCSLEKADALFNLTTSVIRFALNDEPLVPSKILSTISILMDSDHIKTALYNIVTTDVKNVTFKDVFDVFPKKIEDTEVYEFMKNISSKFNSESKLSDLFGSYYNDFVSLMKNSESTIRDLATNLGIDKAGQSTENDKDSIYYFVSQMNSPEKLTIVDLLNGFSFDPFDFCNLFDLFTKYLVNYNETIVYDFLDKVIANETQTLFVKLHSQMVSIYSADSLDKQTWNSTMVNILTPFLEKVEIFLSDAVSMVLSDFRTFYAKAFMENAEENLRDLTDKLAAIILNNKGNSFASYLEDSIYSWLKDLMDGKAKLYGGKLGKENAEGIRYFLLNITSNEDIWAIYKSLSSVFLSDSFDYSFLSNAVENLRILSNRIEADEPFDNLSINIFGVFANCTDADAKKSLEALYQAFVLGNRSALLNYVPENLTLERIEKIFEKLSQEFMSDEIEEYIDELHQESKKMMVNFVLDGSIPMNNIQMFSNLSFLSLCDMKFEKLDSMVNEFNDTATIIINALNENNKYELDIDKIKEKKDFYIKPLVDIIERYHTISEKIKNNANIKEIYEGRFGEEMPNGKYTNETEINELYDLLNFSDVVEFYKTYPKFQFDKFYLYWYNDTETNFSTEGYENDFHIYSKRLSDISKLLYDDILNFTENICKFSFENAMVPFIKANITTLLSDLHDIIIDVDVECVNATQVAGLLQVFGTFIGVNEINSSNELKVNGLEWGIIVLIILVIFLAFGVITFIIRKKTGSRDLKGDDLEADLDNDSNKEDNIQSASIV